MSEVWYRYEDRLVSWGWDEYSERSMGSYVEVRLIKFFVVKKTPKGVWLSSWEPAESWLFEKGPIRDWARFVLRESRKRYACPTKEEAKASFIARKKKQIRIHQSRINSAKEALQKVERGDAQEM